MYNSIQLVVFLSVLLLTAAINSPRACAQIAYNFEEIDTGNILATLHLSSLPATHNEVVKLTFTPAGDAIFGFGMEYDGTFDRSELSLVSDGSGGLTYSIPTTQAAIYDHPLDEVSSVLPDADGLLILIGKLTFINLRSPNSQAINGKFHLVPEPSSLTLLCAACLC